MFACHWVVENPKDDGALYPPLYTDFDISELFHRSGLDAIRMDVHEDWLSGTESDKRI